MNCINKEKKANENKTENENKIKEKRKINKSRFKRYSRLHLHKSHNINLENITYTLNIPNLSDIILNKRKQKKDKKKQKEKIQNVLNDQNYQNNQNILNNLNIVNNPNTLNNLNVLNNSDNSNNSDNPNNSNSSDTLNDLNTPNNVTTLNNTNNPNNLNNFNYPNLLLRKDEIKFLLKVSPYKIKTNKSLQKIFENYTPDDYVNVNNIPYPKYKNQILKNLKIISNIVNNLWVYDSISIKPYPNTKNYHILKIYFTKKMQEHLKRAEIYMRKINEINTFLNIKNIVENTLNYHRGNEPVIRLIYNAIIQKTK